MIADDTPITFNPERVDLPTLPDLAAEREALELLIRTAIDRFAQRTGVPVARVDVDIRNEYVLVAISGERKARRRRVTELKSVRVELAL